MKILIFTMLLLGLCSARGQTKITEYEYISLPYGLDALEPAISRRTMALHYGQHLRSYVENLNRLIKGSALEGETLEDVVLMAEGPLLNNAGQTLNHNLYFLQFSPNGGGRPKGALGQAIQKEWGSFEAFQKAFETQGLALFGSGWVWLAQDQDGALHILQEPNGSNPVRHGMVPLLGFDVWEHAYYLDYANRRADHLTALWNIVDWNVVGARFRQ